MRTSRTSLCLPYSVLPQVSPDWPDSHCNSGSVVKKICVHVYTTINYTSFRIIHEVGNVGIFVLLNFENKMDTVEKSVTITIIESTDKCKFALKLIRLLAISNLFPLKVVQKYQRCQCCVLLENSIILCN